MKKTNTTMKKLISMMMIIAVLAGLAACGGTAATGETDATDTTGEQMQASGNAPTSEGDKQGETTTGQPVDGTSGTSEATDPSTQASTSADPTTEPDTEKTEPSTQPTEPSETRPTQPTTPTQPQPTDPPHQHSYTATVVAPTCNDKGYTKHTCYCGDSYNDNYTDALGHHFIDEVVAPTSSEQGYTKHTCDRCWYSYKDNYTDPVKQVYDVAQAQQIGNDYIASRGAVVTESLVWADVRGYYPPQVLSGFDLDIMGGQEWFNNRVVECVQDTINRVLYMIQDTDITGVNMFCSVTYDASTDKYWIYVYYG